MKRFLFLLAMVGMVAQSAQAADFNHMPEFRFDYTNNMNDDDFVLRTGLLWTTTWKQDNLAARIQLVHTNRWSRLWVADWHRTSGESMSAHHHRHGSAYGSLKLAEASVRWDIMDKMYFAIGRSAKTFGSGKHVSDDADSDFMPRTFDGLSLNYDTGFGWVKVFYSSRKMAMDAAGREAIRQRDVQAGTGIAQQHRQHAREARNRQMEAVGANFDFEGGGILPNLNVHAMQVWDARPVPVQPVAAGAEAPDRTKRIRAAVNLMGEFEMSDMMKIGYDGTFAYVTGDARPMIPSAAAGTVPPATDRSVKAYMWDAMLSVDMSMFKVWAGMHQDTGDKGSTPEDEGYDPFFYDRYNNAGFMNAVNWGNLTYYYFGASAMVPGIDTNVAAYYYMFKNSVAVNETPAPDQEGSELDIVVSRKCSDNVSTSIRYSVLMPKEGSKMAGLNGQPVDREKQQQIYWYTSITF